MRKLICFLSLFTMANIAAARDYELLSPDSRVKLAVTVNRTIEIKISNAGNSLLNASPINLLIEGHTFLPTLKVLRTRYATNNTIDRPGCRSSLLSYQIITTSLLSNSTQAMHSSLRPTGIEIHPWCQNIPQ